MSDLRARCLSAMTEAASDEDKLDALLGVLEENGDEWSLEAWKFPAVSAARRYLEALKPTTEEDRE